MTGARLLQSSISHNSHLEIFTSFDCISFVRAFDIINDMRLLGQAVDHTITKAINMPAQRFYFFPVNSYI